MIDCVCCVDDESLVKTVDFVGLPVAGIFVGIMCGFEDQLPIHHFINSVFFKPTNNDFYW
jgi:hypothetical protein